MTTLIMFRSADKSGEPQELRSKRVNAFGGLSDFLTEHIDYGNHPLPAVGYRPTITKEPGTSTNGWPDTYSGRGDWVVTDVRVYDGDPGGAFDRVVICSCLYAPLKDEDRNWRYCPVGRVSAANFGEGPEAEAAFAAFKLENPEKWKGAKEPATPLV
jgi:hypothetical protein